MADREEMVQAIRVELPAPIQGLSERQRHAERIYDRIIEAGMVPPLKVERLREALRPFAVELTTEVHDDTPITIVWPDVTVTAGAFRRARALLDEDDRPDTDKVRDPLAEAVRLIYSCSNPDPEALGCILGVERGEVRRIRDMVKRRRERGEEDDRG